MREFYPLLAQCPLFQGIPQGELEQVLPRLGARTLRASRHQHLLAAGEPARWMGIVLSGSVRIVHEDYCGNRNILASAAPPQLFGEAFAWVAFPALPVERGGRPGQHRPAAGRPAAAPPLTGRSSRCTPGWWPTC